MTDAELIAALVEHATDWNGQPMPDLEPAKGDPTAGILRAAAARIRELVEVLAPFAFAAREANGYPDFEGFMLALRPDDEDGLGGPDDDRSCLITARQLREARATLAKGADDEVA